MHKLQKTQKHIASLLLTAALTAPLGAALIAAPYRHAAAAQEDRDHMTASGTTTSKPRGVVSWPKNTARITTTPKSKKKEQEEYWAWRHDHPD